MNSYEVLERIYKALKFLCKETNDMFICEPVKVLEQEVKLKSILQRNYKLRAIAYLAAGAAIVKAALSKKRETNKGEDPLQGLPLPDTLKEELEKTIHKLKIKALIRGPLLILYLILLYGAILNGLLEIVAAFEPEIVKNTIIDTLAQMYGHDETLDFANLLPAFLATVLLLITQDKVFEILKHDLEILKTQLDEKQYKQLVKHVLSQQPDKLLPHGLQGKARRITEQT